MSETTLTIKRRRGDYPGASPSGAETGWVIVADDTRGIMAGPYESAEYAETVRTFCCVKQGTHVEEAKIG